LYEGFNFVPGVITGVVVRPDDGLDDLAVVAHLRQDLRLLRLHPRTLHRRQDLGLFPLGNATETYSVTTHSCCDTFLKPAILTSVAIDAEDVTLLVFGARTILYFLLNRTSKETLASFA